MKILVSLCVIVCVWSFYWYTRIEKNVTKAKNLWGYSARECELRYEYYIDSTEHMNTVWNDGGEWRTMVGVKYEICLQVHISFNCSRFVQSSCRRGSYGGVLMRGWYQSCRSMEVNIDPSAITAMPYSSFLWLFCVGNAVSKRLINWYIRHIYYLNFSSLLSAKRWKIIYLLINRLHNFDVCYGCCVFAKKVNIWIDNANIRVVTA